MAEIEKMVARARIRFRELNYEEMQPWEKGNEDQLLEQVNLTPQHQSLIPNPHSLLSHP